MRRPYPAGLPPLGRAPGCGRTAGAFYVAVLLCAHFNHIESRQFSNPKLLVLGIFHGLPDIGLEQRGSGEADKAGRTR